MLASGHQAPAVQAPPKRSAPSSRINSTFGRSSGAAQLRKQSQRTLAFNQQCTIRRCRSAVCQSTASAAPVTEKVGLDAQVAVVLGTQWGDEGKGKLVDILAQKYEIVARAQVSSNITAGIASTLVPPVWPRKSRPNGMGLQSVSALPCREEQMLGTPFMMTMAQSMHYILYLLASSTRVQCVLLAMESSSICPRCLRR